MTYLVLRGVEMFPFFYQNTCVLKYNHYLWRNSKLNQMQKFIKITRSEITQDLDEHVVNLFITRSTQKRLGTLWLDTQEDAEQISKAITALPEIRDALEFFKESLETKPQSLEQAQLISQEVHKRILEAYEKAFA